MTEGKKHLIVYTSKIAESEKDQELTVSQIVDQARKNNAARGITGVLLFENGYFLQAIEGPRDELKELYDTIKQDERHQQLVCLIDKTIELTSFDQWSMEVFTLENSHLFDPQLIGSLKKIYEQEFDLNSKTLIEFIKKVIDEIDTFKISNQTLGSS